MTLRPFPDISVCREARRSKWIEREEEVSHDDVHANASADPGARDAGHPDRTRGEGGVLRARRADFVLRARPEGDLLCGCGIRPLRVPVGPA
jgi:hypothetical protein